MLLNLFIFHILRIVVILLFPNICLAQLHKNYAKRNSHRTFAVAIALVRGMNEEGRATLLVIDNTLFSMVSLTNSHSIIEI